MEVWDRDGFHPVHLDFEWFRYPCAEEELAYDYGCGYAQLIKSKPAITIHEPPARQKHHLKISGTRFFAVRCIR